MQQGIARLAITITLVLGLDTSGAAGFPSLAVGNGNSCRDSCHSNVLADRMEVSGPDVHADLGMQLDGSERGSLATFVTEPGEIVRLMITVLAGADSYSVQLKRLETGGQLNDMLNVLNWTEANDAGNPWTRHEATNPAYFTKNNGFGGGINWLGTPVTYSFDLAIGADTPFDFYDLEFAVAGDSEDFGLWYQDEHFYVQVVPEPATLWLLGTGSVILALAGRRRAARRRRP